MTPSKYQVDLYEWVKSGKGNAIVQAVAGSGKTTSALISMQYMTEDVISLAFNKKIALELQNRIGGMGLPNASAATFHSVGLKAFSKSRGRKFRVFNSKIYNLVDGYCQEKEFWGAKNFITKLVGFAKNYGVGIKGLSSIDDDEVWMNLITTQDLPMDFECGVGDALDIAKNVLKDSNRNLLEIDFDDMIYLPLLHEMDFPQYDWIIIDEAQDTNVCRKLMLTKLLKTSGRLLAIGDKAQAIYMFTGAENDSMNLIKEQFNAIELPLSTCYRCGKKIVEEARKYSANIEAFSSNGDGIVRSESFEPFLENAPSYALTKEDGIVCRNNAPLVSLAFGLIRKGIGCRIEGRDIGNNLLTLCNKWKRVTDLNEFTERLIAFFDKEFDKKNNKAKLQLLEDKLETMVILIERCQSLGKNDVKSLADLIKSMFSNADETNVPNVVVLSSIHKAKGLEFDRCFILGMAQFQPSRYAVTEAALEQERNLQYVAVTRAKDELVYITDVPTRKSQDEGLME